MAAAIMNRVQDNMHDCMAHEVTKEHFCDGAQAFRLHTPRARDTS